jgi:hypothetical protein
VSYGSHETHAGKDFLNAAADYGRGRIPACDGNDFLTCDAYSVGNSVSHNDSLTSFRHSGGQSRRLFYDNSEGLTIYYPDTSTLRRAVAPMRHISICTLRQITQTSPSWTARVSVEYFSIRTTVRWGLNTPGEEIPKFQSHTRLVWSSFRLARFVPQQF